MLYLYVLTFLVDGGSVSGFMLLYLGGFSVVMLTVELWLTTRPLDASSAGELVDSFRTNFFLKIAASEAPVLAGFALALLGDVLVPYLVGLVFGSVGLAMAAPTRGNIERWQREITARGSPLSLGQVLVNTPTAGR